MGSSQFGFAALFTSRKRTSQSINYTDCHVLASLLVLHVVIGRRVVRKGSSEGMEQVKLHVYLEVIYKRNLHECGTSR